MGQLTFLVLHNAATPPKLQLTPAHIRKWHRTPKPKGRGWDRDGYSDLFTRDAVLHNLTPFDQNNEIDQDEMTWGVAGKNSISRHICLEGGVDNLGKPISPLVQYPNLIQPLATYIYYTILRHPQVKVAGHYQFDERKPDCPGLDVPEFCRSIKVPEKNIYVPAK